MGWDGVVHAVGRGCGDVVAGVVVDVVVVGIVAVVDVVVVADPSQPRHDVGLELVYNLVFGE